MNWIKKLIEIIIIINSSIHDSTNNYRCTMGIKLLNTFIRKVPTLGINAIHLRSLSYKKIVIDASIYIYRFLAEDNLIENIYLMCSIFRHYNIHALFIFDGNAPARKKQTILKRREQKDKAEKMYNRYKALLTTTQSQSEKDEIRQQMKELRKKFIRVGAYHIQMVKRLLDAYGIKYMEAQGEADGVCAALVIKKIAYACFSEDTDLFVYGCPRVLKYLSLINHTAVMYDLSTICKNLSMNFIDFQTLCVLSGTDYHKSNFNIFYFYKLFKKYIECQNDNFLEWLLGNYISLQYYLSVKDVQKIYNIKEQQILSKEKYICIQNGRIDKFALRQILQSDGFIFA